MLEGIELRAPYMQGQHSKLSHVSRPYNRNYEQTMANMKPVLNSSKYINNKVEHSGITITL